MERTKMAKRLYYYGTEGVKWKINVTRQMCISVEKELATMKALTQSMSFKPLPALSPSDIPVIARREDEEKEQGRETCHVE